MDFAFLRSNRFWALVGLAVVGVIEGLGWIDLNTSSALKVFFGGFLLVRTVDRASEKLGK